MTIEIQTPELEALIRERMLSGAFQDVEDVLIQALRSSPLPDKALVGQSEERNFAMGTELVAAMQASPFKEISLHLGSERTPVRDFVF